MTAFLRIDRCSACHQDTPWEFVPPILVTGKPLAGTGVWRSALVDEMCPGCLERSAVARQKNRRGSLLRNRFIAQIGIKPYREFTFEKYRVTAGNREAFQLAERFDPSTDNLYLWGSCGVGKTHLAVAILRRWFARGASFALVTPSRLLRKLRMRSPEEEQQTLDAFIRVDVLVLDDFGNGGETLFARQTLQEILDGRDHADRRGLVVTASSSPLDLGRNTTHRALYSRLSALCRIVKLSGADGRQRGAQQSE
jgi:DNA replication protein DnaC